MQCLINIVLYVQITSITLHPESKSERAIIGGMSQPGIIWNKPGMNIALFPCMNIALFRCCKFSKSKINKRQHFLFCITMVFVVSCSFCGYMLCLWLYVVFVVICSVCDYMQCLWLYVVFVVICSVCGYMQCLWLYVVFVVICSVCGLHSVCC